MSNIKKVNIVGELPFCCTEDETICRYLGHLNGPTIGLKIRWTSQPIDHRKNEFGGLTAMYGFFITGEEAVGAGFLENLVKAIIGAGGTVGKAVYVDIENDGYTAEIPIPKR